MAQWWEALGSAGQVFACIAIPATVMLLIQLVLTFMGIGDDADSDADGDTDVDTAEDSGFLGGDVQLFTLRGFIAFFSVLGWVGTICCGGGLHLAVSILIAALSGFAAMVLIAFMMKWLMKLQYDGTENIKNALGVSGTVYLRIPPARSGKGKISAIINGKLCEKNAVTDEEITIERGEEVTVMGISGEETLIVRRKNRI